MSQKVEARIGVLLDVAESGGVCAVPRNRNDYQAMLNRVGGSLVSPFPRQFARRTWWLDLTEPERAVAVMRTLSQADRDWVFCSFSAAAAYGLWVSYRQLGIYHVVGRNGLTYRRGARVYQHACPPGGLGGSRYMQRGVCVVGLVDAAVDCMLASPFPEALAIADSVLRLYRLDHDEFARQVDRLVFRRDGAPVARLAAKYANPLSESGGESIARGIMIEAGFVEPRLQVEIEDPVMPGRPLRVDYYWELADGSVVIGELDGLSKYTDERMRGGRSIAAVARAERDRESRLTVGGRSVLRIASWMLNQPEQIIQLLDAYGVPRVNRRR